MRSQEEITRFAANWLEQRFGDRVSVTFVDAETPEASSAISLAWGTGDRLMSRLPVVLIDDQPARIEWFSAWSLIDAVEDHLKAHVTTSTTL